MKTDKKTDTDGAAYFLIKKFRQKLAQVPVMVYNLYSCCACFLQADRADFLMEKPILQKIGAVLSDGFIAYGNRNGGFWRITI